MLAMRTRLFNCARHIFNFRRKPLFRRQASSKILPSETAIADQGKALPAQENTTSRREREEAFKDRCIKLGALSGVTGLTSLIAGLITQKQLKSAMQPLPIPKDAKTGLAIALVVGVPMALFGLSYYMCQKKYRDIRSINNITNTP